MDLEKLTKLSGDLLDFINEEWVDEKSVNHTKLDNVEIVFILALAISELSFTGGKRKQEEINAQLYRSPNLS